MGNLQPRRRGRYPAELRERAVRMVFEAEPHSSSQWAAICSIAEKLGPTPEAVRRWVRQAEIDRGERGGLTTEERVRLKELERENFELRRANEMAGSGGGLPPAERETDGAEAGPRKVSGSGSRRRSR